MEVAIRSDREHSFWDPQEKAGSMRASGNSQCFCSYTWLHKKPHRSSCAPMSLPRKPGNAWKSRASIKLVLSGTLSSGAAAAADELVCAAQGRVRTVSSMEVCESRGGLVHPVQPQTWAGDRSRAPDGSSSWEQPSHFMAPADLPGFRSESRLGSASVRAEPWRRTTVSFPYCFFHSGAPWQVWTGQRSPHASFYRGRLKWQPLGKQQHRTGEWQSSTF